MWIYLKNNWVLFILKMSGSRGSPCIILLLSVNFYNEVTLESKSNDTLPRNSLAAMEKYGWCKQYKLFIICTKTVFILCAAVIYTGWSV